jgi:hypothetical protein
MLGDITSGKMDDAAPVIREKFGSRFIFADARENEDMFAKLLESGWVEMAYEDSEAKILKIRDVKGEPPKESNDAPETPEEKKMLDEMEKNNTINLNIDEDTEDAK